MWRVLLKCLFFAFIGSLWLWLCQIDRNGVIAKGRLAQLLTEGTSPNPRWLIKFDAQPFKDEEMYERAFGKLLSSVVVEETQDEQQPHDDAESGLENPPTTTVSQQTISGRNSKSNRPHQGTGQRKGGGSITTTKGVGSGSEGETVDGVKKGKNHNRNNTSAADSEDLGAGVNHTVEAVGGTAKKSVQFEGNNGGGSNDGSDDSSPLDESYAGMSRKDRVSAREARSRRRQAKIDEDAVPPGTEIVGGKRLLALDGHIGPPSNKKLKNNESDDGEVVKVKLLTGTLYLYRGAQRRAEFVRRV